MADPERDRAPSLASAVLLAWLAVGCVASVVTELSVPVPAHGRWVRAHHHALNLGQHAALGVSCFAFVEVLRRVAPSARFVRGLAVFGAWALSGFVLLREDLSIFASKLARSVPASLSVGAIVIAISACLTALALIQGRGPRKLRIAAGVALGLALAAANGLTLVRDYPGVHAIVAAAAAWLIAFAVAEPGRAPGKPVLVVLGVLFTLGLWATLVRPPNRVARDQSRATASVIAPFLARMRSARAARAVPTDDPWYRSRRGLSDLPAGSPSVLPKDGIVVLLTADCVRADVITRPELVSRFPALERLAREGVRFEQARTTAPATTQALASLFTSTLYSQLRWATKEGENARYFYPHLDPTPRFTERLSAAGIVTASVQGLPGIAERTGLVRGMRVERFLPPERKRFAGSQAQLPVMLELLRANRAGPFFLYAHFDDPHAPYDRAGTEGSDFERYLREIGLVDQAVGAVWRTLGELGASERAVLIFSADHGEAFGEHGMTSHASSLYDEQLRIPLLVRAPGLAPRVVAEPVSLLDVGPTVLELFGLPVPGHAMGQSLVPLMRGERERLERPMLFESGRAQRGMLFPDGLKLVTDQRHDTLELFDLRVDPGELQDLGDLRPAELEARLARMNQLFAVHRSSEPGYVLPFAR